MPFIKIYVCPRPPIFKNSQSDCNLTCWLLDVWSFLTPSNFQWFSLLMNLNKQKASSRDHLSKYAEIILRKTPLRRNTTLSKANGKRLEMHNSNL